MGSHSTCRYRKKKNAFQNNNKRKYFWIERNDRPIFLRKNSGKTNIFFYFKKFFYKIILLKILFKKSVIDTL